MWKATLAGNTVYLLGAIHAASPAVYTLPKFIESAFRRSSVLLVETNVDRLTQQQKRDLAGPYALYPAGDSLWNHVSPELRKVIESIWCETRADCETVAIDDTLGPRGRRPERQRHALEFGNRSPFSERRRRTDCGRGIGIQ